MRSTIGALFVVATLLGRWAHRPFGQAPSAPCPCRRLEHVVPVDPDGRVGLRPISAPCGSRSRGRREAWLNSVPGVLRLRRLHDR